MKNKLSIALLLLSVFTFFSCKNSIELVNRKYRDGFHLAIKTNPKRKNQIQEKSSTENVSTLKKNFDKETMFASKNENTIVNTKLNHILDQENSKELINQPETKNYFYLKKNHNKVDRNNGIHHKFIPEKADVIKINNYNKEYNKNKQQPSDKDIKLVVLVVLSIILPPLAIYLKTENTGTWFWITLGLCLASLFVFFYSLAGLIWLSAIAIGLLVVFDQIN